MKHVKYYFAFSLFLLALAGFSSAQVDDMTASKGKFGAKISTKDPVDVKDLPKALEGKDSMWVRVKGDVTAICQKKGCWMTMDMGSDQTMRVRFKDYGFFVPRNGTGTTAIMEGWAYRRMISVEELRHYAQDAGKSKEEIEKITQPEMEYTFYADGVILKKKKK